MSVLARDIMKKKADYDIKPKELKCTLADILQKEEKDHFNEKKFEDEWEQCYKERNYTSHGKESKLLGI